MRSWVSLLHNAAMHLCRVWWRTLTWIESRPASSRNSCRYRQITPQRSHRHPVRAASLSLPHHLLLVSVVVVGVEVVVVAIGSGPIVPHGEVVHPPSNRVPDTLPLPPPTIVNPNRPTLSNTLPCRTPHQLSTHSMLLPAKPLSRSSSARPHATLSHSPSLRLPRNPLHPHLQQPP